MSRTLLFLLDLMNDYSFTVSTIVRHKGISTELLRYRLVRLVRELDRNIRVLGLPMLRSSRCEVVSRLRAGNRLLYVSSIS